MPTSGPWLSVIFLSVSPTLMFRLSMVSVPGATSCVLRVVQQLKGRAYDAFPCSQQPSKFLQFHMLGTACVSLHGPML
jgi:hypothetical protein